MKLAQIFIGILALAAVILVADAVATDFWTFHEYRATIEAQRAEIGRLQNDLLEYQRLTTDLKHAALAAK